MLRILSASQQKKRMSRTGFARGNRNGKIKSQEVHKLWNGNSG